jgi:hypothetical protein
VLCEERERLKNTTCKVPVRLHGWLPHSTQQREKIIQEEDSLSLGFLSKRISLLKSLPWKQRRVTHGFFEGHDDTKKNPMNEGMMLLDDDRHPRTIIVFIINVDRSPTYFHSTCLSCKLQFHVLQETKAKEF